MAGIEQQYIPEIAQDIYLKVQDGDLNETEKQEILTHNEAEKIQVQQETQNNLQELRTFLEIFQESLTLSRDDIVQLQMILSFPREGRDGVFWPTSFQKFINYQEETGFSWNIKTLLLTYETEKQLFETLSWEEKKARQAEGEKDGIWGQNTFRYILSQENSSFPQEQKITEEVRVEEESIISHIPGDQHPEENITFDTEETKNSQWVREEEPSETLEEKILRFREEASGYQKVLLSQLQEHLGEITVDGAFWPNSLERLFTVYPEVQNMQEAFDIAGINMDIDGILSPDGNPEVFRNLYGAYVEQLGNDLWLPLWFIEAIIKQETTYGADLVSNTGSHGLMQLTRWPFKDMRGDSWDRIGVSSETVLRYQEIFRRIDLDALLATPIGEEGITRDRIPENIILALSTIQTSNDIAEIQEQITLLYEYLKRNGEDFHDHEVNMLIGSVYLANLYQNHEENIEITAREYNSSPNEMLAYGRNVERYYNTIVAERD